MTCSMGLCLLVYLHPNLQKNSTDFRLFPLSNKHMSKKIPTEPLKHTPCTQKIQNMEGNFIISFHKQVVTWLRVWCEIFQRIVLDIRMILTIRSVPPCSFVGKGHGRWRNQLLRTGLVSLGTTHGTFQHHRARRL